MINLKINLSADWLGTVVGAILLTLRIGHL